MSNTDDLLYSPIGGVIEQPDVPDASNNSLKLKDSVFIHYVKGVAVYGQIISMTDTEMRIWVENGEYELRITKSPYPCVPGQTYQEMLDKFDTDRVW